jgi:hypothetical protein
MIFYAGAEEKFMNKNSYMDFVAMKDPFVS